MKKNILFKSIDDFGRSLGLTDIDMEIIRQKKRLIEKLKAARIKQKLSQSDLAKLVGSKQPTIARMESLQVSHVSMDFLIRVAIALKVSVSIKPIKEAA